MITTEFATRMIALIFNNADAADVGDAAGLQNSAAAGSIYVGLYTAAVDASGNQTTNEISYTGYTRPAVARSGAGWTCAAEIASNAAAVQFGLCSAGSPTGIWVGVGSAASGAGHLYGGCPLDSPISVSVGLNPTFAICALRVRLLSTS